MAALWLSGAAVSFGTGLWCVHFITAAARPLSLPLGYGGTLTALGWLGGVLASAAALKLVATGGIGALRLAPAALLVAVVAVASKMLYVHRHAPGARAAMGVAVARRSPWPA